jgi:translation initiation factor 2 alpha subunit (eIF-2alpha)
MPQDSTRRLLREFGVAVTAFEDAVAAAQGEAAKKAEAALREHLKGLIELVERLSEQAAKL